MSLSIAALRRFRRGPTGYRTLYSVLRRTSGIVSFLLMILQAIAAPLPAFLSPLPMRRCLARSGAAYCRGPFDGRRGAVLFYRQSDGPRSVEKLTGKTVLDSMDGFFTRYANTPSWYVGYCLLSLSIQSACCRFDFNTFSLVFYRHRAW